MKLDNEHIEKALMYLKEFGTLSTSILQFKLRVSHEHANKILLHIREFHKDKLKMTKEEKIIFNLSKICEEVRLKNLERQRINANTPVCTT